MSLTRLLLRSYDSCERNLARRKARGHQSAFLGAHSTRHCSTREGGPRSPCPQVEQGFHPHPFTSSVSAPPESCSRTRLSFLQRAGRRRIMPEEGQRSTYRARSTRFLPLRALDAAQVKGLWSPFLLKMLHSLPPSRYYPNFTGELLQTCSPFSHGPTRLPPSPHPLIRQAEAQTELDGPEMLPMAIRYTVGHKRQLCTGAEGRSVKEEPATDQVEASSNSAFPILVYGLFSYFCIKWPKISLSTFAESLGYRLHPSSLSTIVIPNRGP
jgi:hypothetical protein